MEEKTEGNVNVRIAQRVRQLRAQRGLTLDALASRCGISRSMISLIERGESSPTAVLLEKLATGLGVPLASLFEAAQADRSPVVRRAEQLAWRDPHSGYVRRNLSPPGTVGHDGSSPLQLVEVDFPPQARVAYETGPRDADIHQQVWVLAGCVELSVGDESFHLDTGDCLAMVLDRPVCYHNPGDTPARYMVAITTLASSSPTPRRSTP